MSGIGVEHDQSGDSAGVISSVDSRERSSDRVADEEEYGVGCKLLKDRIEVMSDLDEVVAEWSDVCGVRVWSEAIELGVSVVGKKSKTARTLESARLTSLFALQIQSGVHRLRRDYLPRGKIDTP
jgi:hypothetical protein